MCGEARCSQLGETKTQKSSLGFRRLFVKLHQRLDGPASAEVGASHLDRPRRWRLHGASDTAAHQAHGQEPAQRLLLAQRQTRMSLRPPDLGAVVQVIRLHFVTDFWTLPSSRASSRNWPPPRDTNPFQARAGETGENEVLHNSPWPSHPGGKRKRTLGGGTFFSPSRFHSGQKEVWRFCASSRLPKGLRLPWVRQKCCCWPAGAQLCSSRRTGPGGF